MRVVWRSPAAGAEHDPRRDARRDARRDRPPGAMAATVGIVRTLRRGGVLGVPMDLRAQAHGAETVLTGELSDQAALYGVLAQIEALGLELLELRRTQLGRPG